MVEASEKVMVNAWIGGFRIECHDELSESEKTTLDISFDFPLIHILREIKGVELMNQPQMTFTKDEAKKLIDMLSFCLENNRWDELEEVYSLPIEQQRKEVIE